MRRLLPTPADDVDLAEDYAYPETPWLRANMISSADGGASLEGRAGSLGDATDQALLGLLRALADCVIAGARTVRAERYGPVTVSAANRARRKELGMPPTPSIVVVSNSLDFSPDAPLFADAPAHARTIVLTTGSADADRRTALAKHADVVLAGDDRVDIATAIDILIERGHRRLLCEGGPYLLGEIVDADRLDELCLTLSPVLVAGEAPRITHHLVEHSATLRLSHLLEHDGLLYLKYRVARNQPTPSAGCRH